MYLQRGAQLHSRQSSSLASCFQSFQAGHRSKSPGHMFRNPNQVVLFLELLMSPGKSIQIGLKVYVVVFFFFCQALLKTHPSQMGFCMEFAVEECH